MADAGADSRSGRLARGVSFWLAASVALLVAHDAVFAMQAGAGRPAAELLRTAAHAYWPVATGLVLASAVIGGAWWAMRLATLRRLTGAGGSRRLPPARSSWRGRAVTMWPRLFVLVAAAFLLQENVEHLYVHGHLIGLGALIGPEYPLAIPVLAAVTALAAAVAALVRDREAALVRRILIERAYRVGQEAVQPRRRPCRELPGRLDPLSLLRAGRAPPSPVLVSDAA
jgi:hypothetical protein